MKVLDLFSGIGGFSLGFEITGMFETAAFCEIDPFCQKVLRKNWPETHIFNDVRTLSRKDINDEIGIICAGYPCQPHSVAGSQKGEKDPRYLWPEIKRLLIEFRPAWFIGENVKGHINNGLDRVLTDLEEIGYSTRVFSVPAKAFGANHGRERIWIVAYTASHGCDESEKPRSDVQADDNGTERSNENIDDERCSGIWSAMDWNGYSPWQWGTEPPALRVDDGIPDRMDRCKSLGNTINPIMPQLIGRIIGEVTRTQ